MAVRFRQVWQLLFAPLFLTVLVGTSEAQELPVCLQQSNLSSAPIPAADVTGVVVDIAVRTDQGNLALVTVSGGANLILIRGLQLFDPAGQEIVVQRQDFAIVNGMQYDVDTGVQTTEGADLFWNVLEDVRQLEPVNGAQIVQCPVAPVILPPPTPVEALPVCLQQNNFAAESIPGVDLANGDVAVRTDQGNLALLKVRLGDAGTANGTQLFNLVIDELQLFDAAGQNLLLSTQDLAISTSFLFDVDTGVQTSNGADIWWNLDGGIYRLTPRNGAQIFLCPTGQVTPPPNAPAPEAPTQPAPNAALPVCLQQPNFSATPIPAANVTGVIADVAVRTDQGNLAFVTVAGGANLILIRGLQLFDAAGQEIAVQRQDFAIINGMQYDLDTGVQTTESADLFWNVLEDVRQLEPVNGAQIYFCPGSVVTPPPNNQAPDNPAPDSPAPVTPTPEAPAPAQPTEPSLTDTINSIIGGN